jgi:hypothetical protein
MIMEYLTIRIILEAPPGRAGSFTEGRDMYAAKPYPVRISCAGKKLLADR